MTKNITAQVLEWVLENVDEYMDSIGDTDLTELEESAMIEFDLTDKDFDDLDLSFLIWQAMDKREK